MKSLHGILAKMHWIQILGIIISSRAGVFSTFTSSRGRTLLEEHQGHLRGPGTREKVRLERINLEGNTHAQEINVSQLPV
jgi:hypothetical protein